MLLIAKIRDNFPYSIHLEIKKDFKILFPLPEFSTMKNPLIFFLEMTQGLSDCNEDALGVKTALKVQERKLLCTLISTFIASF